MLDQGHWEKAQKLYEQFCHDDSSDFDSHYLLGLIRARLGRFLEAEKVLREAEACKSDSQEILIALANVLLRQSKVFEAEKRYRRVLQFSPDSTMALHGLGEVYQVQSKFDKASEFYRMALKIDPDLPVTRCSIGHIRHLQGNYKEAIMHLRHAVTLRPDFMIAYRNLGSALVDADRLDDARVAFEKALQIDCKDPGNIYCMAEFHERQGDYQSAWKRIASVVETGTLHTGVAIVYVNICLFIDRCKEAILYANRVQACNATQPYARSQLFFALGKHYDRLGEHDKAFDHYRLGNQLIPVHYDRESDLRRVTALVQTFNKQFMDAAPRATISSRRPVFIVGMPRSGTSLIEQILASHPDVHGAGELPNIPRIVNSLPEVLGHHPGFPYNVARLTTGILNELAQQYLDQIADLNPAASRVTDKLPGNYLFLGLIELLFPDARIIHCVRDPLDTCLSNYFQFFNLSVTHANNLKNIGLHYRQYVRLMEHYRCVLKIPILVVHYEELVTNQEEVSRRLIDFVDLDWDGKCLEFYKTARYVSTSSYAQVRRPLYTESIGRWKHYEKHLQPLLDALDGR